MIRTVIAKLGSRFESRTGNLSFISVLLELECASQA